MMFLCENMYLPKSPSPTYDFKQYDDLIRMNNERKIKLDLRGEEDGEGRESNGNKHKIDRGIKVKKLKNIAQDRDQYSEWKNGPTLEGNKDRCRR